MSTSEDAAESILEFIESVFDLTSDRYESISNTVENIKHTHSEVLEIAAWTKSAQESVTDVFSNFSETRDNSVVTFFEIVFYLVSSVYNLGNSNVSDLFDVSKNKVGSVVDEIVNWWCWCWTCWSSVRLEFTNLLSIEVNVSIVVLRGISSVVSTVKSSLGRQVACISNLSQGLCEWSSWVHEGAQNVVWSFWLSWDVVHVGAWIGLVC